MLGWTNTLSFVDFIRKLSRGFVLIEWVLTLKKLEGQRKTGLFSSSAPSGGLGVVHGFFALTMRGDGTYDQTRYH